MELRGEIRVLRDLAREGEGGRVEEPPCGAPAPILGRPLELLHDIPDALNADDAFPVHRQDRVVGLRVRELRLLIADEHLVLRKPLGL